MRIIATSILVLVANTALAVECEPALHNLVKILSNKGDLAPGKNVYIKKFSASEFSGSCETTFEGQEYELFLHPDEVTIVVSHTDPESDVVKFQGPFYSAYRK